VYRQEKIYIHVLERHKTLITNLFQHTFKFCIAAPSKSFKHSD